MKFIGFSGMTNFEEFADFQGMEFSVFNFECFLNFMASSRFSVSNETFFINCVIFCLPASNGVLKELEV